MNLDRCAALLADLEPVRIRGRVRQAIGLVVQAEGLALPVGAVCEIRTSAGGRIPCEVVGFRDELTLLMPHEELQGVRRGDDVLCRSQVQRVPVGRALLGRVIDSQGAPIDGGPPLAVDLVQPLQAKAPHPLDRPRIQEPLGTGVRALDALLTCGKGQRMGLFAGSGVGKSTLLGMCARGTAADVTVIALVGERGREVREFIEKDLGPEGLKRSVVVVETSERPALLRVRAPFAATAVAEYFRDQGLDVLLLMDSITRMANAQREVGLSAGEPPATKGYPPSVFAQMPRLLERAGRSCKGSITGFYTVLVEGDDVNEPIADTARSILDGHVWLSRSLAVRGQYPAIDVLQSVSRLMTEVATPDQAAAALRVRTLLAVYEEAADLVNVGAYVKGSNPEIDLAVQARPALLQFLKQGIAEGSTLEASRKALIEVARPFLGKDR
ncbi:MAG TPA: FliI/YscN family ATPase [Planctomycetota bacterium]|nr:FliI/YscN family ATPase [Planctomycetota bacterium]